MLRITLGRSVGRSGLAMKSCPPHLLLLSPPSPLPPMARESETTNVLGQTSSDSKSSYTSSSRPLLPMPILVSFRMNSGRVSAFLSYHIWAVGKPRQP